MIPEGFKALLLCFEDIYLSLERADYGVIMFATDTICVNMDVPILRGVYYSFKNAEHNQPARAGGGGAGLAKPSGTRDLHSGEGEDGKCGHGVGDTGFAFQSPARTRANFSYATANNQFWNQGK